MKKIFVYTIEVFGLQILVAVGATAEQIKKWADKNSKELKEIYKIKENFENTEQAIEKNSGFVQVFTKDNIQFYFLWLQEYKNTWCRLDVLNHEVVHLRQFIFDNKKIINEVEFEAYFQESMFREIRKRLDKYIKK